MARTTIQESAPRKNSSSDGDKLPPGKKRMAIAATVVLICSLGVVGWYFASSEPEYIVVPGAPPPETTIITVTNTTNSPASVKIQSASEATPPTGFTGDGTPPKDPMHASLEPQQFDKFILSDGAAHATDAPAEIEIEATVNGTTIKGTFQIPRKSRAFINLYDAAGSLTFDTGPGIVAK